MAIFLCTHIFSYIHVDWAVEEVKLLFFFNLKGRILKLKREGRERSIHMFTLYKGTFKKQIKWVFGRNVCFNNLLSNFQYVNHLWENFHRLQELEKVAKKFMSFVEWLHIPSDLSLKLKLSSPSALCNTLQDSNRFLQSTPNFCMAPQQC